MRIDEIGNRMLEKERQRRAEVGELVDIKRFAAELGVSVRTIRRWNSRPDAPPRFRRGRQLLYRRADVECWVEQVRRAG